MKTKLSELKIQFYIFEFADHAFPLARKLLIFGLGRMEAGYFKIVISKDCNLYLLNHMLQYYALR